MTQALEDASNFGKEFFDSGLKSFSSLSKSAQAIAAEASAYAKKSYESGSAAVEKLLAAPSFDKAMQIQGDYAKQAYESFIAEATKMGELYADLSKEAYRPFESIVAKVK